MLPMSRVQHVDYCFKFCSLILLEHLYISTVWSSVFGRILKCKIPGVSEELVPFPSRSEFKMVHNFGMLEH